MKQKLPPKRLGPQYDLDAAARVAYESFVKGIGRKVGEVVSDTSGVHRIGSWNDFKTFQKERWRRLAANVIRAATKNPA